MTPITGASYQWSYDGSAIAGATAPTLTLPNISSSASGSYSVQITTPGAVATASAAISVQAVAGFSPHLVDPTFHASLNGNVIYPVTALPNGQLLYGGNLLLNSDGSSAATLSGGLPNPWQVLVQPDGKWIELEWQGSQTAAVRFNTDGTVDTGFQVDPSTNQGYSGLALLPSGKFVIFTNSGTTLQWWRLNPDGSIDPTFGSTPGTAAIPAQSGTPVTAVDSEGRTYVGMGNAGGAPSSAPGLTLLRLDANQNLDPSFAVPPLLFTGTSFLYQLQAVSGGLLYLASSNGAPLEIGLLSNSGTPAAGYQTQVLPSGTAAILQPDGTAVAAEPTISPLSPLACALHRFSASGQLDANFGGVVVGDPVGGSGAVSDSFSQIVPVGSGAYVVSGAFSSLNTIATAGLGRLLPDTSYAQTRLVNLSARGYVAPQEPLTIGGYLSGSADQSMDFLLRGSGPALAQFGIPDPLPAAQIELFEGQTAVASNAGWSSSPSAATIATLGASLGAYAFAPGSADAALIAQLSPGPFSLQLSSAAGSGVALDEAWDASGPPPDASTIRISNYSCLGNTAPGASQLTLGFVLAGPDVKQVLIRAVGPSLASFGLPAASLLAQPVLTVYQGESAVATSQGWTSASATGALEAGTANQVGAFALPNDSADCVLLLTLPAGAYTAVASGTGATSGTALLEVYEVP